ncbi:MAG: transglutaminase domain-containing protein [Deltaproteobacteria bacterium]|nr:transglutaminase domain-containing protein [Deltaproteobacteria bacterium]
MPISAISSNIDITPLIPPQPPKPDSVVDVLPKPEEGKDTLFVLLQNMATLKLAVIQWTPEPGDGAGYEAYLQYPNAEIAALAATIVSPAQSNDQKMYEIEQWVQDNITYVSDLENYSTPELWTYPTVTLERRSGDCEDGAFLLHSLALHAGVPSDRLRTYGGIVWADDLGLSTAGHAWTAYRRELDDQWIILDWCYWAQNTPIAERTPMREDYKYVDDYFFVDVKGTTETPYTNRVRYAYVQKGSLLNVRA